MCKSASKTFEELGVEVFEIGARQCRKLFGWRGMPFSVGIYRALLNRANCDTMRKGAYLVAVAGVRFGRQCSCLDLYGDGTVGFAVHELRFFQTCDRSMAAPDCPLDNRFQHHVEVWHLVDDDELWGDWERRVLDSRLTSEKIAECESVDAAEDTVSPVVMYGSRVSGSSDEYLCGVWVAEVQQYVTVSYSYPNYDVSCVDDWQGTQPMTFEECDAYGWMPWPYDELLEVDLPCSEVDWEIVCRDGDQYCCMDLEDVRETLRRDHMLPLGAEYVGMYGDPTTPPDIYSPVAVVKVRACCL